MKAVIVLSLALCLGLAAAAGASGVWTDAKAGVGNACPTPSLSLAPKGSGAAAVESELAALAWTDNPEETLHWDGRNYNAVGLTGGGTYSGAARFTPTFSCTVKAVLFYQRDASSNDFVFIFGEANDTTPGAILESVPYTGSGSMTWKRVNLTTPLVTVAGTDFWACVRVTHDSGDFPLGVDSGPMLRNRGGFISTGGGRWRQLADVNPQLNYNWNIRAIVERVPGLDHDVGVSAILSPEANISPGSYAPKARVTNFGTNPESNIPVVCWIDSAGTRVYNQMTNYAGPLQPGTRAEVTFTPNWNTGPAGNRYTVKMFTALPGDLNIANDTTTQITSIASGQALMTHDTGYCKLSVTCFGSIGYDNPPADLGGGFCYPKTAVSALFYSSFAVGNGIDYVADRHFSRPASGPVNNDLRPVDSLRPIEPPEAGDEHFRGSFSDAGHPTPKTLKVFQNSYQASASGYGDFVVLVWDIENDGAEPVNGLYAGVFADFDIGASPATNSATSDEARRMTYMRQVSSANPTVGVKILEPRSFANLCAIDHARYVYPDTCMTDSQKFRILNGTIVQRNSNRPYDWSVCTSVGPFDLAAGGRYRFSAAFVGGIDEAGAMAHADSAQSWYNQYVGLAEGRVRELTGDGFAVEPSLFKDGASVHYSSRTPGWFELQAFDAAGRLVDERQLLIKAGNGSYYWQPKGLTRGVYFLSLRTPDQATVVKTLLLE